MVDVHPLPITKYLNIIEKNKEKIKQLKNGIKYYEKEIQNLKSNY